MKPPAPQCSLLLRRLTIQTRAYADSLPRMGLANALLNNAALQHGGTGTETETSQGHQMDVDQSEEDSMDIDEGRLCMEAQRKEQFEKKRCLLFRLMDKGLLPDVLQHLEPIWVLQLEIAYEKVRVFLQDLARNEFWYKVMPAPLLVQPDHFQDEVQLGHKMTIATRDEFSGSASTPDPHYHVDAASIVNVSSPLSFGRSYPRNQTVRDGLLLPRIDNMSSLQHEATVNPTRDTRHPTNGNIHYPLVSLPDGTYRPRFLAVGGTYHHEISYRREILGHLHQGLRCWLCFESFGAPGPAASRIIYGAKLCEECFEAYTVPLNGFSEFMIHVKKAVRAAIVTQAKSPWPPLHHDTAKGTLVWRPFVDNICRELTAMDYKLAGAKTWYVVQLLVASRLEAKVEQARRLVRVQIAEVARDLWQAAKVKDTRSEDIIWLRERYIPTSKLLYFLFCRTRLNASDRFLPIPESKYLNDPTTAFGRVPDVNRRLDDATWINEQANNMLGELVKNPWKVGVAVDAAMEYQLGRIRSSFNVATLFALARQRGIEARRLRCILRKVGTYGHGVRITRAGKRKAAKDLGRLMESVVHDCPITHKMAPRGLRALLSHVASSHQKEFFKEDDWMVLG